MRFFARARRPPFPSFESGSRGRRFGRIFFVANE
jgi:hypothetical protein